MSTFQQDFQNQIKNTPIFQNEPLAKYTTIGIGGNAQYFATITRVQDMINAYTLAQKYNLPVKVIGGGSNIIINDKGITGLVLRNQILDWQIQNTKETPQAQKIQITPRLQQLTDISKYQADSLPPSFTTETETILVTVGSAWKMNALIQNCFKNGLTGIEWFSGIPGSVGGATYMNMHGGKWFWSDFVHSVTVITPEGVLKTYPLAEIAFDYDISPFQKTKEIIVSNTLRLYKGDVEKAKKIFSYWAVNKTTNQPQNSAGCMYHNLTERERQKANLPTSGVGYLIDKELGLKGKIIGGAKISEKHCAFIENLGGATSADVQALVQLVKQSAKEKFDIDIIGEVEFVD